MGLQLLEVTDCHHPHSPHPNSPLQHHLLESQAHQRISHFSLYTKALCSVASFP